MLSYKKILQFQDEINYIFNNMEHQALVTFVVVCVTMIAPVEVKWQTKGGPCYTFLRLDRKTYVNVNVHMQKIQWRGPMM
jgi:hypothetical protein